MKTKTEIKEPTIEPRLSIGARKVAKAIADSLLTGFPERQARNNRVSVYDIDCAIYFYGQFASHDQFLFTQEIQKMTQTKFRTELETWVLAYNTWYHLGDRQNK